MLEAAAYSARAIFDALHADGVCAERIVAVGGGTKGDLWTQIVSDVTGVPQELSEETIGACYGDALFAARAAGLVEAMDTWATYAETVQPRPALRERYDRLYGSPSSSTRGGAMVSCSSESGSSRCRSIPGIGQARSRRGVVWRHAGGGARAPGAGHTG